MIFHHCFLDPRPFAGYTVSFAPFSQDFTVSLSYFSKICVGIFAFISGYGLYLSFSKQPNTAKSASAWTVSRTIKTMSGYWFIYILALISTWIYADLPIKTYCTDGNIRGAFYAFLDFLGLASLFQNANTKYNLVVHGCRDSLYRIGSLFYPVSQKNRLCTACHFNCYVAPFAKSRLSRQHQSIRLSLGTFYLVCSLPSIICLRAWHNFNPYRIKHCGQLCAFSFGSAH